MHLIVIIAMALTMVTARDKLKALTTPLFSLRGGNSTHFFELNTVKKIPYWFTEYNTTRYEIKLTYSQIDRYDVNAEV